MEWIGKLLSVHTGDTWYVGKEFFDMNEKEQKEIKAEEERIRENGQATLEENGKRIHLLSIIGRSRDMRTCREAQRRRNMNISCRSSPRWRAMRRLAVS